MFVPNKLLLVLLKEINFHVMKRMNFQLLAVFIVTGQILFSQNWGSLVTFDDVETTYPVYSKTFMYSDTPFLVTDLREGARYETVESYETRTVTVYRSLEDGTYPEDRPVVFFVHGGAWVDEYAFWYKFVAQSFTGEMGWVTAIVEYRLTSDSVFIADEYCPNRDECYDSIHRTKAAWYPDNINDVAEAFQWVSDSIANHGGDANNIFVFGHSAGAHLASLLGTHENFISKREKIKGLISMSGAYRLKTLNMNVFGDAIDQSFHGGHIDNDEELDEASPVTYLTQSEDFPHFFLLHCSMDLPSLSEQKVIFNTTLVLNNVPVEASFLMNYNHVSEMVAIGDINDPITQQVIEFIETNMTQTIQVSEGWSGISGYINPTQNQIEDVLADHLQQIQWIENQSGIYDPANNINTIQTWTPETGYLIKAVENFDFLLTGTVIQNQNPELENGWNLMPVWRKNEISTADFAQQNPGIILVKEVAGTKLFWPEYGIQSLLNLQPGKAYWVFLNGTSN